MNKITYFVSLKLRSIKKDYDMKKTLLFIVFVFTIRTCFSITINELTQDLTDLVAEAGFREIRK